VILGTNEGEIFRLKVYKEVNLGSIWYINGKTAKGERKKDSQKKESKGGIANPLY